MNSTHLYATDEVPVVPSLGISLCSLDGSVVIRDLNAKLDSGSCRTIVPEWIVNQVSGAPDGHCNIEAIGGGTLKRTVHRIWLIIHGHSAIAVDVVSDPFEPDILVGRDIMNQFVITLDGPNQRVEVCEP